MFSAEDLCDVPFDLSVYSKCHDLVNVFLLAFVLNLGNISIELFVLLLLCLVEVTVALIFGLQLQSGHALAKLPNNSLFCLPLPSLTFLLSAESKCTIRFKE